MKYILPGATLILALISGNAAAQGNFDDKKIMSRLTTGEYTGPYFSKDEANPLIILKDGESSFKIEKSALKEIDESWIDKMDVLKGEKAIQMYGKEGKDGVVVITFKEGAEAAKLYIEKMKKNQKEL
jgi:hypothetical protein